MTAPGGHDAQLEREAIRRLRNGDIGGLELLVHRHQSRAIRTAYLITRDLALAQDVVQSAFVRAFERIGQLDPNRSFGPWFCTSVLHDAIKVAVRNARHSSLDSDSAGVAARLVDRAPDPETLWEQAETAQEVWLAMGRLTPEQRAAIVARYFLGLSESDTSRLLACPTSTVKWRLHAARARLRLFLAPAIGSE